MKQPKMKIRLTLFLLVIFSLTIKAQEYQYIPFPDSNAVWSEVFVEPDYEANTMKYIYNKFALFNEDTVLNGITYHKFFHTHEAEINPDNSVCIGGIREDSTKKVWFNRWEKSNAEKAYANENGEILLYDFSINYGDTLEPTDHVFLTYSSRLTIKNIDTLQIGGSLRKVFSFKELRHPQWIEGIGNKKGVVMRMDDLTHNDGMNNYLVCFHQNDSLIYFDYERFESCVPAFVFNDAPFMLNPKIKVYPNPVTNNTVRFENLHFESIELYDMYGGLIRTESIKRKSEIELILTGLSPGIYTYFIKSKGMVPVQGKLVIQ